MLQKNHATELRHVLCEGRRLGVSFRPVMNTLVSIPNVSAPCPVNTCPVSQPDGTIVCIPCGGPQGPGSGPAVSVPALGTGALLLFGAALVLAGVMRLRASL